MIFMRCDAMRLSSKKKTTFPHQTHKQKQIYFLWHTNF